MKKKISVFILALIILLGAVLRLYKLGTVPAGLHFDEAVAGYNAFLLEKTGKNLSGEFLPLDIDSFGDYRPAMISYLSAPLVRLFGLSEFTTRLPTAISGIILIVLAFCFSQIIFRSNRLALLGSLLVAVSPFDIIFSRATTEGHLDLMFELLAILFLLLGLKNGKARFFLLTYLFYLLSFFSYHTSRILTPLFAVPTIVLASWQFKPARKTIFLSIIPVILFLVFPLAYFSQKPIGVGRFQQVSIFTFPEVQRSLNELIREDGNKEMVLLSRLLHNKPVAYMQDIAERYSYFFSPQTILFSLSQPDRYFVPKTGAITFIEFTGLILCLVVFLGRKNRPIGYLPLALLLLAPLPSALTFEATPNFQRALFMVPFWQIVAATGITAFIARPWRRTKLILLPVLAVFFVQTFYFFHEYFIHQPSRIPRSRNSEMKSIALFLGAEKEKFSQTILPERGGTFIYYLFYNQIDVSQAKVEKPGKYFTGDFKINHLTFSKNDCLNSGDLLKQKFDIGIFLYGCLRPNWATGIAQFNYQDFGQAAKAYDLKSPIYDDFFQRNVKADLEKTFTKE